jgi:hypothetical protein
MTKETTGAVDKFSCLAKLIDADYDIINDTVGWLTSDIIHAAQVLLQEVNPAIEGFQLLVLFETLL